MQIKRVFPLRPNRHQAHFLYDLLFIAISVLFAVWLAQSGFIAALIAKTSRYIYLEMFVAGMFFTSAFTTAPAIAALAQISRAAPSIWPVVLLGALGAMCGDLIIYEFMKDRINEDVMYMLGERKGIKSIFHVKLFRWLSFLIGGAIISSPLPDELGIAMMGFSKLGILTFIPVSITFNSLGVLLISLGGRIV